MICLRSPADFFQSQGENPGVPTFSTLPGSFCSNPRPAPALGSGLPGARGLGVLSRAPLLPLLCPIHYPQGSLPRGIQNMQWLFVEHFVSGSWGLTQLRKSSTCPHRPHCPGLLISQHNGLVMRWSVVYPGHRTSQPW